MAPNNSLYNTTGLYRVGTTFYENKLKAFKEAAKSGGSPHWDFHESEFDSWNWTIEPTKSLTQLYTERALRIREKYDILVLGYSGGADSATVGDIFVNAGIRLDAVFNRAIYDSVIRTQTDTIDERNLFSESVKAAWPGYLKLKEKQPDLEWFAWDYTKYMSEFWANNKNIDPYTSNSYSVFHVVFPMVSELLKKKYPGKSIGYIIGLDKPIMFYHEEQYKICFLDQAMHNHIPSRPAGVDYIPFFWSDDSAELLIKQAHILKKYCNKNSRLKESLSHFPKRTDPDSWRFHVNNCGIYTIDKMAIWNANKPSRKWKHPAFECFFARDDQYATNYNRYFMSHISEAKEIFVDSPNTLLANGTYDGLPSCYSKLYSVGV